MKKLRFTTVRVLMAAMVAMMMTACAQQKTEVTLQVKTQAGVVEGFAEDGVKKFLGVPFAAAPVGGSEAVSPNCADGPCWHLLSAASDVGIHQVHSVVARASPFRLHRHVFQTGQFGCSNHACLHFRMGMFYAAIYSPV